jgi:hypothetical protein
MTPRRTLILLSLAAALPVSPAAAQSGVIIDDDSPADKEYAIPLESAREDAAGASGGGSSSSGAPLFGAGVGDSGNDSRPKSSQRDPQKSSRRPSPATETTSVQSGRTAAATVPEGGVSTTATIIAVALSVLVLGGVIGSIARRRTTPA